MSTRHRKFAKAQLLNEGLSGEADASAIQPSILASLNVDPIDIAGKKTAAVSKRKERDETEDPLPKSSMADLDDSSSDEDLAMNITLLRGHEATSDKKRKVADSGTALPYVTKYSQQRLLSNDSVNNKFPYWNDDMDALLLEANQLYSNQWMKVAAYVGHGKTDRHCYKRWSTRFRVNPPECNVPWSDDDEKALLQMVEELNQDPSSSGSNAALNHDWEVIGRNLSSNDVTRTGKDCKAHMKLLEQTEPLLEGDITKEEVDFMSVRVRAWAGADGANGGKTRWNALGREMRRDPKALQEKWLLVKKGSGGGGSASGSSAASAASKAYAFKNSGSDGHSSDDEDYDPAAMLSGGAGSGSGGSFSQAAKVGGKKMDFSHAHRIEHSLSRFSWSPATDALLAEAVSIHGPKWRKVAQHVGHGVNNVQCQKRWSRCDANPNVSDKASGPWTEEEMEKLKSLCETNVIPGGGKNKLQCINWAQISTLLNRPVKECMVKHKSMLIAGMKKGRFLPEEDEAIVQGVLEWQRGGLGQGLWASLEKQLNRNAASILTRWNLTLSKTVNLGSEEK